MIVFIGCVKQKKNYKTQAQDLYDSVFFEKCLNFAKSYNPKNIYILSAKYGLLNLTDEIEPYECTLNNMSIKEQKNWAEKVLNQMKQHDIDFTEETVWLCGNNYRKYLLQNFQKYSCPLEGLGIGKQLKFMTDKLNSRIDIESEVLW